MLDFSDISYEWWNYGKLEGIMTGLQYDINTCVGGCAACLLSTSCDWDAYGIEIGLEEVIDIVILDISFEVCNDGKLEEIVIEVQDGINYDIVLCVSGGLVTGFDGNADGITLGLSKGIHIDFQADLFRIVIIEILRFLWQYYNTVSIMVLVVVLPMIWAQVFM